MELLRFLEDARSPLLNSVIGLITQLGEETVGIILLCVIFWCISKRAAYRIGIAYFLSGLTVQGMKICFRIDRPWIADTTLTPVESAVKNATGYSFPSGHTQSATALFGSLGLQIKEKPVKALCFLIVLLVAFSRLYLGVHTLLDVAVSLVISMLLVMLAIKIAGKDGPVSKKRELILALILILYAIVIIVIAAALYSGEMIGREYLQDCLKAAGAGVGFAAGMYIERVYIDFPVKTKSLVMQIIKPVAGIAGVLAIKEGLKLVIGTSLAADIIRYFIMLIWVTVLFPLIISRFFANKDRSGSENGNEE